MNDHLKIDGQSLTIEDVVKVTRDLAQVEIAPESRDAILRSREEVDRCVSGSKAVYGLNTGFGKFSDVAIDEKDLDHLQYNLIVSHSCGTGDPLPTDAVRAIMLLRANALAKGFSGIRLETVDLIISMLNSRVHPIVPEKGSVGSSGDLCPLSHMVLTMIGLGKAEHDGKVMAGAEAMRAAGLEPTSLKAKEGLALINGTCAMLGVGALAAHDARVLAKTADIAAAMTAEALGGITDAYDAQLHNARPHKGQQDSATNLRALLSGSQLTTRQGQVRIQDAYSLRCVPQIHGASRLAMDYVDGVVTTELNSATDNPLIFTDTHDVISGGNFHGQPVAVAMDTLSIASAEIANVSERRTARMLDPSMSGLPGFLSPGEGLHNGFMIAQYTAAALVSENKVLAHPASVDSIPTSANQEDHVSMGTIAARQAAEIVSNAQDVLAIELMCAAQAIDLKDAKGKMSKATRAVYDLIRETVSFYDKDRFVSPDIAAIKALLRSEKILRAAEEITGKLA